MFYADVLCYDCFVNCWWELREDVPICRWSKHPTKVFYMSYLLSHGLNKGEIAKVLGVNRRTITRWCANLRKDFPRFMKIMAQIDEVGAGTI